MEELLRDVGAFAGLAAFLGLALLALLYFAQARDVRRLRENASFLVEGSDVPTNASPEEAAAAVAAKEPEEAAAAAAASAPSDREAFRRAELARQAAERRKRFEQRRRGPGRPFGWRPSWLSDSRSIAVIAVGAVLLIAGIAFGATQLLGGDEASSPKAKSGPAAAAATRVGVLNGTAAPGLAGEFAQILKEAGFTTRPVTNTEEPIDVSTVMFVPGSQQAASQAAGAVGIQKTEPITPEIQAIAEGASVVLVLGEDKAGGSSSGTTGTTASGI
jgi:LytR cell envelope-related transcriptional attenuator